MTGHWRTIKQGYNDLKKSDPDTALTERLLRELIVYGAIPSFKSGTKYLFRMEDLEAYLIDTEAFDRDTAKAEYLRSKER